MSKRKAAGAKADQFKQNGWFVGVTPRRNPDIVVAMFFEAGEHGRLAARLVAPIIKAFVDKQRRVRNDNNYAAVDKDGHPIAVSGIWSEGKAEDGISDRMLAGTLEFPMDDRSPGPPRSAKALTAQSGKKTAETVVPVVSFVSAASPGDGSRRSVSTPALFAAKVH